MTALGGTVKEYGDRVCVAIESNKAVIHRRGQQTYLSTHAVECVRDFLRLVQIEGLIK